GQAVRTNSEALFGVMVPDAQESFSEGVAITSILHTDDHSHVEPVRYGPGSDFFRYLVLPHAPGDSALSRIAGSLGQLMRRPRGWFKAYTARPFSDKSPILLYMRTIDGTIRFRLGRSMMTGGKRGLVSELEPGSEAPKAFMPEATDIANRFKEKVGGFAATMMTETFLGSPSTAHILGGACMGESATDG